MIDYHQALERLLAQIQALPAQRCALGEAAGRVLAGAVVSPMALPSFDHAAMDGYALRASPSLAAASEHVVYGSQAAGDTSDEGADPGDGDACEIMTGASIPTGLDAVVAVERTECLDRRADGTPARIRLLDAMHAGDNVRYAGSDVGIDAAVLAPGDCLASAQIMLLAALGVATVDVAAQPRVAIICTGKELQCDPRAPLVAGRIHNSNGPYLAAALVAAGACVLSCETVDDTAVTYTEALQRAVAAGADLIVSTGAVSMGRYDFVPEVLRRFHAQLLFHKVAIRPGKPLLAARLDRGPLVIALPGTPMAVAAGLRFIVVPALRAMTGQGREPVMHAWLDTPQQPKPGLRHFLRASLYQHLDGQLRVRVNEHQQPFRIRPFAQADAWVVLPEDAGDCPAGTRVQVVGVEPVGAPLFRSPP
jgi:molybdopterin molybdotransferase